MLKLQSYQNQSEANKQALRELISDVMDSIESPVCGQYRFGVAITDDGMKVVCLNFHTMPDLHVAVTLPAHSVWDKEAMIDYIIDRYDDCYKIENYLSNP